MGNKPRILIVDDNISIHEDIKGVLLSGVLAKKNADLAIMENELFGIDQTPDATGIHVLHPGYEIDDAYQGDEAVAMVNAAFRDGRPYSLVFMDVRMPPGMDGVQTLKKIWENHKDVEAVICSAFSDYSWKEILAELGTNDRLLFLPKPFNSVAVKQMALAMTTKWELDRQNQDYIDDLESKVTERTKELKKLVKEKEQYICLIQEELVFAQTVQQHFLPQAMPEFETLDLSSFYVPAVEVGGDFFDVIMLDVNRVALLIFDVSGHGLAASLVTAIGKSSFAVHLQTSQSPARVLELVNRDIVASTPKDMYITAFLMVIDLDTRMATYARAGHVPPMLYRARQGKVVELRCVGLYLGIMEDTFYEEKTLQFDEGDRLLLYTDGLTEAMNPAKVLYGRERLKQCIAGNAGLDAQGLQNAVMADNEAHMAGETRKDDICILCAAFSESRFAVFLKTLLPEPEQNNPLVYKTIRQESEIDWVNSSVLHELDKNGYSDRTIKQMRVVIVEILLNAIYHGNGGDQTKKVRIAYDVNTERVFFGVMDEGAGFDPESIPHPARPENQCKTDGRGVFIVKHYVDSLKVVGDGNCVILVTYRKRGEET